MLVIEYADGGTLRDHLEKNFDTITWNDKYRLGSQIASAVECLHDEGIIHRDLVIKGFLFHLLKLYAAYTVHR